MKDIVGSIYVSLGFLVIVLTYFNSFHGPEYLRMTGWVLIIIGVTNHLSTQIKVLFKPSEPEENQN